MTDGSRLVPRSGSSSGDPAPEQLHQHGANLQTVSQEVPGEHSAQCRATPCSTARLSPTGEMEDGSRLELRSKLSSGNPALEQLPQHDSDVSVASQKATMLIFFL